VFFIPTRYKVYALLVVAFVFGLLRWRNTAIESAIHKLEQKQRDEADRARNTNRVVRDEIEILDDVGLYSRADPLGWAGNQSGHFMIAAAFAYWFAVIGYAWSGEYPHRWVMFGCLAAVYLALEPPKAAHLPTRWRRI
jgi:diacylglycerol kinase